MPNGNGSENFMKGLGILSQYECTTDNNKIICRTASSVMTRKIFKKDCTCKYRTYIEIFKYRYIHKKLGWNLPESQVHQQCTLSVRLLTDASSC
jgi:hypothetical protein